MIVRFLKPDSNIGSAKLTVHKTGKLGLSKGAMEMLNTKRNRFVRFGFDDIGQLMMEVSENAKENSFQIARAGLYDYINAKTMLEELGIDYTTKHTVIFDIKKTNDKATFRLNERIIKKRTSEN